VQVLLETLGKLPVQPQDLARPHGGIPRADAARLRSRPQLEIRETVVIPNAIAMVHVFERLAVPPEFFFEDEGVFEDLSPRPSSRVLGEVHHQVPLVMADPTATPLKFAGPTCPCAAQQPAHRLDFFCLVLPQAHASFDRQVGQAGCPLEGVKHLAHWTQNAIPPG